jgi:hypothetical protein
MNNPEPGRVFLAAILTEHGESRSKYRRDALSGFRLPLRKDPRGRLFLTAAEAKVQAAAVAEGLPPDELRAVVARLLEQRGPVRKALTEFAQEAPCA